MLPGDRLIAMFTDNSAAGDRFSRWPLHITIVPWFRLPADPKQLSIGLRKALYDIKSFDAGLTGRALFGPHHNRPAHLVEPEAFAQIEAKVRRYLHQKRAWLVDETTKTRHPFRPHITFQNGEKLTDDRQIHCSSLAIVEQRGNYKEVVALIRFDND